jgi:ABC-type Fe3+ transport system substrate-binding protein
MSTVDTRIRRWTLSATGPGAVYGPLEGTVISAQLLNEGSLDPSVVDIFVTNTPDNPLSWVKLGTLAAQPDAVDSFVAQASWKYFRADGVTVPPLSSQRVAVSVH